MPPAQETLNHKEDSASRPTKQLALLCAAKAIRTFALSSISIILALYLLQNGFSALAVGVIFSATLIEDAVATTLVATMAARIGLRLVLLAASALVIVGGLALAFCQVPWILCLASVFGIISPAGYEGGPFAPIEQTIIAQSFPADKLTRAFSWYNLTGFWGAAAGALATGTFIALSHSCHFTHPYQAIFIAYAGAGVLLTLIYSRLSLTSLGSSNSHGDERAKSFSARDLFAMRRSSKHIWRLSMLQGLDSFGGGFVAQAIIAYWFYLRYQAGPEVTGPLFFWLNVLAAISFSIAPIFVRRFGLLKTMVFTHLPCSLALCAIPLMPSFACASMLMLARSLFSSMDIPVRQAYTMLLVADDERPAAAAVTNAMRAVAQGLAPMFTGCLISNPVAGLPFIFAGVCKSAYDVGLYLCFRHVPLFQGEDPNIVPPKTTKPGKMPSLVGAR